MAIELVDFYVTPIRLYGKDFNLISQKSGLTYPDRCMQVNHNNCVYLISEFDFETEKIQSKRKNTNSALCGSKLLQIENDLFLVYGELNPRLRTGYVYKKISL